MSANIFRLSASLLIVGLLSACGSDTTTSTTDTQEIVQADTPANDDSLNGTTEQVSEGGEVETIQSDPVESDPAESDSGPSGEADSQDVDNNTSDLVNDGEQANTESQQESSDSDTEVADSEPSVADNQRVNFGAAKLLVDLVPNGDSYPSKFHLAGDKLYFWTVDTNPRFASCAPHWGRLGEDDKNVMFNLAAVHPQTGVVAMNKEMMSLGDFAENPNEACAGYNNTVMDVFEQAWMTPSSGAGEQQFAVHFKSTLVGPDKVWVTDGNEANTRVLETGRIDERLIFEGGKVFFVTDDELLVSNSMTGDRRMLFQSDDDWYDSGIKRVVRSPARETTFEINVGSNRSQIWSYNLDTDEWEKKFSIKPDNNTYRHDETLLVDGQTLLSLGSEFDEYGSVLGVSSQYGEVKSFEIITDEAPDSPYGDPLGRNVRIFGDDNYDRLVYRTTDYRAEPRVHSIWSYRDYQHERLFTVSEAELQDVEPMVGFNGRVYVSATKKLGGDEANTNLLLWSYDPQTGQLVKLSDDDWYARVYNQPLLDEGYYFKYLITPDGLIFVNHKGESGRELWFTDGTREATRQLADINPGRGHSDPENFYYGGGAVYFSANDGTHGHEPWMIQISR